MYPLNTYRIGLLAAHTFLWVVGEKFFSTGSIFFCRRYVALRDTQKIFFVKDITIKKKVTVKFHPILRYSKVLRSNSP